MTDFPREEDFEAGAGEGDQGWSGQADLPTEEQFAFENLLPDFDEPLDEPEPGERAAAGEPEESGFADWPRQETVAEPNRQPINAEPARQPEPGAQPGEQEAVEPGTPAGEPATEETGEVDGAAEVEVADGAGVADDAATPEPITDAGQTEVMEPVAAAAYVPQPSASPGLPNRPSAEGDPEPPPKRPRLFLSFFLAAVLIIGSVAGASSASVLLFFGDIAADLRENAIDVEGVIVEASSGEPQTILLLGSDKRTTDAVDRPALSDTAMLVRIDPKRDRIAMMSIPRDLKVDIPNHGINKFNAAYAFGGPKLTVRTIKQLTGGLEINHVVNIDFEGFIRVVDELNCLYINVDRRYYHSNEGLAPSAQYMEIDLQPGYQKLCGEDALTYARYRHTDSDLVRAARQHEVIREARQRMPISKLIADRDELLKIFTTYTTSDIASTSQMIELLNLGIDARDATISEVNFPAVNEPPAGPNAPAYVVATPEAIAAAVDQFLGFEASSGPRGELGRQTGEEDQGNKAKGKKAKKKKKKKKAAKPPTPESDGLVDAAEGSRQVALTAAGQVGPNFPIYYPQRLPSGTIYAQDARIYHLRDTEKNTHGAYTMVMQMQPQGDFFNLQGIRGWTDPPILEGPHETIKRNGREFDVYYAGDRVRLVAWRDGDCVYWIANSLLQSLTNDQMIGMAASVDVVVPKKKSRATMLANQQAAQQ
jgi:LCP family protein required for cell wall assembly